MKIQFIIILLTALGWLGSTAMANRQAASETLRVMLIPSDGGTEDGTRDDWQPLFDALSRHTGFNFEIRVGQSYSSVVEAIAAGRIDIAYMGTVSFLIARERGPVEVLAIGEMDGGAFYYAGLFTLNESDIYTVADLRGRSLALTDPGSSSGFVYPLNILLREGINPVRELSRVMITGSHANSLNALLQGHVDVAAAPFESYVRAVRSGVVDPRRIRILAKSDPIPNPPLVVSGRVDAGVRQKLRETLHNLHTFPDVRPNMLRGHAGRIVERYNAEVPEEIFTLALENMANVDDETRDALMRRAAERQRR